jgi:hypothetical protein
LKRYPKEHPPAGKVGNSGGGSSVAAVGPERNETQREIRRRPGRQEPPASVWERPRGTAAIIAIRWWRREMWLVLCSPTVMPVSLAAAVAVGRARLPGKGLNARRKLRPAP